MTAKKRIDWEALRARLSRSADATEDAARLEAVYRERAAELAAPRGGAEGRAGTITVLAFTLGGERYALPLADLAGVLRPERLTPVPGSPPELIGVINHNGNICSVLDLARLLGLPARDAGAAFVLLLRRPGREVGLGVDTVEGLVRVSPGVDLGEGAGRDTLYLETLTPDRLRLTSAAALLSHPLLSEASGP